MRTEFLLATLQRVGCVLGAMSGIATVLLTVGTILTFIFWTASYDAKEKAETWSWHIYVRAYLFVVLPICIIVNSIPTVDDLWKVRISLIKLELASPQNIEKGSEEIARIAKKLECKYIGCEEKK